MILSNNLKKKGHSAMTYNGSSEAQRKAVAKYQSEKVEDIKIRVPKGEKEYYKKEASNRDLSLNEFAIRAMKYIISHNIKLKK